MSLINPGFGLVIWMTIAFGILLWILAKFAWPAITDALAEREKSIEEALLSADKARKAMEELKHSNEELLNEAKDQRDAILKEARALKENMINEGKEDYNISCHFKCCSTILISSSIFCKLTS